MVRTIALAAAHLLTLWADISGKGDDDMIKQYGMKLDDTVLAEPHQLGLFDDLIKNRDGKLVAGGGAQNTARGAQYMLPPNSTLYIGCVGNDEYANTLREACKKEGKPFIPLDHGRATTVG